MLRELGVAPSTYYDALTRVHTPSAHHIRDRELLEEIRALHAQSGGVYGSPRVFGLLKAGGVSVSRKRVERLMREDGLAGVSPRTHRKRPTCEKRNAAARRDDDLVHRVFHTDAPNRLWVTDLTMIHTGEGPLWLSSIRDAFSRRIVAWDTSPSADADLVLTVLEHALASRRPPADGTLVHHADHGTQYTSLRLTTRLLKAQVRASMGTVGDSFDNALAENMWSTIKAECVHLHPEHFATRADADTALFQYIDGFYNTTRAQENLGFRSPIAFEDAYRAGDLTQEDLTRLAEAADKRRRRRRSTPDPGPPPDQDPPGPPASPTPTPHPAIPLAESALPPTPTARTRHHLTRHQLPTAPTDAPSNPRPTAKRVRPNERIRKQPTPA